ncbi:hypothetical protein RND81_01G114500 [Saponaria officinalis]|uniref:Dirigent protein n=1 Tax=Saponaria officinalis TaxID=3572 RepID=A0AAW1N9G5_SAPOF
MKQMALRQTLQSMTAGPVAQPLPLVAGLVVQPLSLVAELVVQPLSLVAELVVQSLSLVAGLVVQPLSLVEELVQVLELTVPFAKPNGAVLPTSNGVPQNNANNGIINNNNVPFLTGLGGVNPNVMQNNGNNNFVGGNGFPVVNGAQFSAQSSLQQLMFGTMIAIDDELTESHELGSGMVGRAQGFYVYSSIDGKTQTMAFTTMFQEGGYVNSLNFFGVHQTSVSESLIAVMGGTGKYVNAKGFALVKTLPVAQQETDGLETVLEFNVYLTY